MRWAGGTAARAQRHGSADPIGHPSHPRSMHSQTPTQTSSGGQRGKAKRGALGRQPKPHPHPTDTGNRLPLGPRTPGRSAGRGGGSAGSTCRRLFSSASHKLCVSTQCCVMRTYALPTFGASGNAPLRRYANRAEHTPSTGFSPTPQHPTHSIKRAVLKKERVSKGSFFA